MKNLRSLFVVSIIMFAVTCGLAQSAMAQDQYLPPTSADLDQFRFDLDKQIVDIYNHSQAFRQNAVVRETLAKNSTPDKPTFTPAALAAARQQLQQANYDELAILHKAYTINFPDWRSAPQALAGIADKVSKVSPKTSVASQSASAPNTSNYTIPDDCELVFGDPPSFADFALAQGLAIGAEGAMNVVPPLLNGIVTGAWVAASEAALVLEVLNATYDRCDGNVNHAQILDKFVDIDDDLFNHHIFSIEKFGALTQFNINHQFETTVAKGEILGSIQGLGLGLELALNTSTANITTAVTTAENHIVTNDNTNAASLNTALTTAKTELTASITDTKNVLNASITTAKTDILTDAATNTQNILNDADANTTSIVSNDNANRATIINNATANTTLLLNNGNTNSGNIIANDNQNAAMLNTAITNAKNEILTNANTHNAAMTLLVLRTGIEVDLAQPDNATYMAMYVTPTSNGGQLDLVREIVAETITKLAGSRTAQANAFLAEADAFKAAGNWKAAYQSYRKAYKTAVG